MSLIGKKIRESRQTDDQSLLESVGPALKEIDTTRSSIGIYTSEKFRKETQIYSVGLVVAMAAVFFPIFVTFLINNILDQDEEYVPNLYKVVRVDQADSYLVITAFYTGQQEPQFPDIFPYISLNISLQTIPDSQNPGQPISFLNMEFKQTAGTQDAIDSSLYTKSSPQNPSDQDSKLVLSDVDFGQFDLEYSEEGSKLGFIISRRSTKETLLNSISFDILLSEYASTLGTLIPSGMFYGLGERRTSQYPYNIHGDNPQCTYGSCNLYRFWNTNPSIDGVLFDTGKGGGYLAGYQPVYLMQEKSNFYSLLYLDSSHSGLEMEYYQNVENEDQEALVFRAFSPNLQLKLFLGSTYYPNDVIAQYHQLLGKFQMIPFWAMGYHHSKAFTTGAQANSFLTFLQSLNFPIDGIWTGSEMYTGTNQFSVNDPSIPKTISSFGIKWVPTVLTPIAQTNEVYFNAAMAGSSLILSNKTKQPIISDGFAGKSVFVDFNSADSQSLWKTALTDLFTQGNFGGVFLSSNEPSLLITGEYIPISNTDNPIIYKLNTSNGIFDSIYKNITQLNFNDHLLNTDALHYNQPDAVYSYSAQAGEYQYERDMHVLNGHMQTATTYGILKTDLKFDIPFIVTSSNMPGTGKFGAHTNGVIPSKWSYIETAFQEAFNNQLYMQPFSGSQICPIMTPLTSVSAIAELCARWYQVGSVLPLMHSYFNNDYDLLTFQDFPYVLQAAKNSLKQRYQLLKHYYSLFVLNQGTKMVLQPVSFVFPENMYTNYISIYYNNTAMIGDSLFVITVMESGDQTQNSTQIWVSFPNGLWVDVSDSNRIFKGPFQTKQNIGFGSRPLIFLREGKIIFWQNILESKKLITTSLADMSNIFTMKAVGSITKMNNLDISYFATGSTLGIIDYNSSKSIEECGKNTCQLQANIVVTSSNNNQLDIAVNFVIPTGKYYFEPGIVISQIEISGIMKYNEFLINSQTNVDYKNQPYDLITVTKKFTLLEYWVVDQPGKQFSITIKF